jgi:ABC-type nitrate/sulfonate/bicarbonate transport system substrate-binding protein
MRKVALTIACPHAHEHAGPSLSRRGFLGQVMAFGMAAVAASTRRDGHTVRAPARAIKFSHGTGLCSMPLFDAAEKKLFAKYAIEDDVVMTPMAGASAIQLATGQVEMGVMPYTTAIAAYTRSRRSRWWPLASATVPPSSSSSSASSSPSPWGRCIA